MNHDLVQVSPLLPVLQDIKNFLKRSTDEVIIVDFHRFPVGFMGRAGRHRRLVALLHQELGHYAVPPSSIFFNMTLGQIWNTHQRLIISYGDSQVARGMNIELFCTETSSQDEDTDLLSIQEVQYLVCNISTNKLYMKGDVQIMKHIICLHTEVLMNSKCIRSNSAILLKYMAKLAIFTIFT